jgi:hypothetical protein
MVAKITIKRNKINTVRSLPPLLLRSHISLCQYSYQWHILTLQVYRRLYEDGVCIVEDFFDDALQTSLQDENYPKALFSCSPTQQEFITKKNVSRDTIFDGVKRSTVTCGYDNFHPEEKKKGNQTSKAVSGPGPRQQLKPCKVTQLYTIMSNVLNVLTEPVVHYARVWCRWMLKRWRSMKIKCGSY